MFHYFNTLTDDKGNSLPGYQVEVVQLADGQTVVPIFSDENETPIQTVSGVANRALSDAAGNYDFFVEDGTYSLRFYDAEGGFLKTQRYLPFYGAPTEGGGGDIAIEQDGSAIVAEASAVNFTGSVAITDGGNGIANVTIAGGGLARGNTITSDGSSSYALPLGLPVSIVTLDGLAQPKSAFSVAGQVITFAESVPNGTLIDVYYGDSSGGDVAPSIVVNSIAVIEALPSPVAGDVVYLNAGGRSGWFSFNSGDLSGEVSSGTAKGIYIAPDSDATGASGAWVRQFEGEVYPDWFGAVGDGVADDTAAIQAAIDFLEGQGGGRLLCDGDFVVGGLTIAESHISIEGTSRSSRIQVKVGTTGFTVSESWVHFRHLRIESQGAMTDGTITNGILYTRGSSNQSISHIYNYDLDVGRVTPGDADGQGGFSGFGMEVRNAVDVTMISCFFYKCATGLKFGRNGTGQADFNTTIQLLNVYVIGCEDFGIDADRVYRSTFTVIAEFNGVGISGNIGDFDLDRCYFESNVSGGAVLTDVSGQDRNNYSAPSLGVNTVSRVRSVIANTDWATSSQDRFGNFSSKRVGVQTVWGRDTVYFSGAGTTNNIAPKYGEAIVPRVYGDDLLNPTSWESWTTSEFVGWSPENNGFAISTSLSGVRGMKQTVALDSSKTYVIDFAARNTSGNPITFVRVDGIDRTPGVPFTVGTTGSKVVGCFSSQSVVSLNYVEVFRLMEVVEDQSVIAHATDVVARKATQRGDIYTTAAPATGVWAIGEIVKNSNLNVDASNMILTGWICTSAGAPGTWSPMYVSTVSPAT